MRARNIKPSLFKNEELGTADPLLTILFEGLWCEADREGRLEDRPLRLKAEILPYRNDANIETLLMWLSDKGFITRYEARNTKVIQVCKFSEHQRPHTNEVESVLPAMEEIKHTQGRKSAQPRKKVLRSDSLILIPDSGSLIPDPLIPSSLRSEGAGGKPNGQEKQKPSHRVPESFRVDPALAALAAELPADFDLEAETAKFRDHEFQAPRRDWPAAWRGWMRKARDRRDYARKRSDLALIERADAPAILPSGEPNPVVVVKGKAVRRFVVGPQGQVGKNIEAMEFR